MGNKAYRESHKEQIKEQHRKYRELNRAMLTAKSIKWMHEHPEARERHRKYMVKYNAEHKHKAVKTSIKPKFKVMNQNIKPSNRNFESINIDNIAKAIDEYMSAHSIIKLEMNNKLWIFLRDRFGEELTEHRYRFMINALKKSLI
jgi:hypothetical protein